MDLANEYYAWVDAAELIEPGHRQVRLDAFNAEVMQDLAHYPHYSEFRHMLQPTIFETDMPELETSRLHGLRGGEFETDRWYKIRIGRRGVPLIEYRSTEERSAILAMMADAEPVDGRTHEGKVLSQVFSLADHRAASEQEIRAAFDIQGADEARLCVYDVGQGSCAALCDEDRIPLVYFDFGGRVTRNAKTYPANLKLCLCRNQPVILSHWDMDHWVGGRRHQGALASTWLVPDQRMGPSHRAFAEDLINQGNLLKWPDDLERIALSWGWITKLPRRRDRNHSGLVVVAHVGEEILRALVPGDAPYHRIPVVDKNDISLLVATHHGGWYRKDVPPRAAKGGTAFYSYGAGNSYKHPAWGSVQKHEIAGWKIDRADTPAGHACRPTPSKLPAPPACGGHGCTLAIEQ